MDSKSNALSKGQWELFKKVAPDQVKDEKKKAEIETSKKNGFETYWGISAWQQFGPMMDNASSLVPVNHSGVISSSHIRNDTNNIAHGNALTSNNKFFSQETVIRQFNQMLKHVETTISTVVSGWDCKQNSYRLELVRKGDSTYVEVVEDHSQFWHIIPLEMSKFNAASNWYFHEVHKNQDDQTFSVIIAVESNRLLLSEVERLESKNIQEWCERKEDRAVLDFPQSVKVVKSVFDCNQKKQLLKEQCSHVAVLVEALKDKGKTSGKYSLYIASYFRDAKGILQARKKKIEEFLRSPTVDYSNLLFDSALKQIIVIGVGSEENERSKSVVWVKQVSYGKKILSKEKQFLLKVDSGLYSQSTSIGAPYVNAGTPLMKPLLYCTTNPGNANSQIIGVEGFSELVIVETVPEDGVFAKYLVEGNDQA